MDKIAKTFKKILYFSIGLVFLVLGVLCLLFPPIPGFVLIFVGITLMAKASTQFNNWKPIAGLQIFLRSRIIDFKKVAERVMGIFL